MGIKDLFRSKDRDALATWHTETSGVFLRDALSEIYDAQAAGLQEGLVNRLKISSIAACASTNYLAGIYIRNYEYLSWKRVEYGNALECTRAMFSYYLVHPDPDDTERLATDVMHDIFGRVAAPTPWSRDVHELFAAVAALALRDGTKLWQWDLPIVRLIYGALEGQFPPLEPAACAATMNVASGQATRWDTRDSVEYGAWPTLRDRGKELHPMLVFPQLSSSAISNSLSSFGDFSIDSLLQYNTLNGSVFNPSAK